MSRGRETIGTPGRGSASTAAADRRAFVERLETIMRHWPSADRLARAMGVSPSALRKWLRGETEPSRERLVALAEAAGVAVGWLASGEGPQPQFGRAAAPRHGRGDVSGVDLDRFVLLPKQAEAVAAGLETPTPAELATEFIALRHDWIRSRLGVEPRNVMLETASGESMSPSIRDRDLLLIDIADHKFRTFGVYVLEHGGERLVKRVQRKLDGSLVLISDNSAYEVEHITPDLAKEVRGIGRVIWSGGPVRRFGTEP